MIQFTADARRMVDEYYAQVRACVGASKSADEDDVLADVTDHIEQELIDSPQPVEVETLQSVLDRLGSPQQWVAMDELGWWDQLTLKLRTGPEDWRLAYLSLALLVFGTPLTGPIGLLGSFFLARAAVKLSEPEELEAKKWLVYPSLIIVYVLFAMIVLFWPAASILPGLLSTGLFDFSTGPFFDHDGLGNILACCSVAGIVSLVWWALLWAKVRKHPDIVKKVFKPFAGTWKANRFFGRLFSVVGVVVVLTAILSAGLAINESREQEIHDQRIREREAQERASIVHPERYRIVKFEFNHGGANYDVKAGLSNNPDGALLAGQMIVHQREIRIRHFIGGTMDEFEFSPDEESGASYPVPSGVHYYAGDGKLTKIADSWPEEIYRDKNARQQFWDEVVIPNLPSE